MTAQIAEADRELRYETLNKNSALNQLEDQTKKLGEFGKQLEEKESEISKLKSKIRNQAQSHAQQQQQWNNTYQQGCRQVEFWQAEYNRLAAQNNHLEMRLQDVCVGASQMENELRFCRANVGQSQWLQCEAKRLKNQLAEEKKKTKDSNKPNPEYEMLLSEKNALIAEYESGNDSK